MASLQIHELPDDVYEALSHRARREGRSLAQQAVAELRKMPESAARSLRLETVHRLRERTATPPVAGKVTPPEELIRRDRDQ